MRVGDKGTSRENKSQTSLAVTAKLISASKVGFLPRMTISSLVLCVLQEC